jgi:hypothetical protein
LNNRIFVERSFENLHCTNLSKLMEESIQILMNENKKSFYSLDMFEFIHHPEYGCRDLKGLINEKRYNAKTVQKLVIVLLQEVKDEKARKQQQMKVIYDTLDQR